MVLDHFVIVQGQLCNSDFCYYVIKRNNEKCIETITETASKNAPISKTTKYFK